MALIKSISGIRGTIGGISGEALTPPDIVLFSAAYATWVRQNNPERRPKVVVGRDGRMSGDIVNRLVCGTLLGCGIDVIDAGLASTPTVEMAVVWEKAEGGIVLTASHNPREWNALKLLNHFGEFLDTQESSQLFEIAERQNFYFAPVDLLGKYSQKGFTQQHIDAVIAHPLVDVGAIYCSGFSVVLDGVNSVGGVIVPKLLENLGVACIPHNCDPTGDFAHNPEPLPEHLTALSQLVVSKKADLGIAVDPDVDRLAFVCEDGTPFGEEYTLVAIADYVLGLRKGNLVSNLSSTLALDDIAKHHGCTRYLSAVGEVNVVTEMKRRNAVIGGEGNGGVIIPDLHYGRDALIGIALFLTHLAYQKVSCSQLKGRYAPYYMVKERVDIPKCLDLNAVFSRIKKSYKNQKISELDGLKIEFEAEKKWVIIRASNTEPVLRIYAEAATMEEAKALVQNLPDFITPKQKFTKYY
ncbi:MAG: phosphoglucosamine mutase [Bacteroidales bacterium]|nr:phosphoglucosamine mutase [Bacteroidales bacterium]